MARIMVTRTVVIDVPEGILDYDRQCYVDRAYEMDLGSPDTIQAADSLVGHAMAHDYMERYEGCTASTYLVSDTTESRAI